MKVVLSSVIVMVLLAGNLVLAAPEDDRFKGGGYDGHDALDFLQTSTDLDLIFARYEGNGYDGYANGKAQTVPIPPPPPRGTVIKIF